MNKPYPQRKSPRKADYDYSLSGAYFVTICTHERALIFGDVVDDTMHHTELGQIAHNCWETVSEHFPHVRVESFVVMPNHVHAIIIIEDHNMVGTRHALSVDKKQYKNKDGRFFPSGVKSGSLGAIVGSYKSAVTKTANRTLFDPPSSLWQSRYHDHIIRNQKEFDMIFQYVLSNPSRWNEDRFNL
jgi:putative transposase